MALINKNIFIKYPPEIVFGYLSDVESHIRWSGELSFGLKSIEKITSGPLDVGSTFTSVGLLMANDEVIDISTVTYIEQNRVLSWETISEGPGQRHTFRWSYSLEEEGLGTRLMYSLEGRRFSPMPFRLRFPPLLWITDRLIFGKEMEAGLEKIKKSLES